MQDASPDGRQRWRSRRGLADAWKLAAPFWRARGEAKSWALLASVIGLTLAGVWVNVRFSQWNNAFYDTLQNHDLAAFWRQLGIFVLLATGYIVVAVYRQYLQQILLIRWRTWLTDHLLSRWLQPGTAYRLEAEAGQGMDNPDQRIAEDARGFVSLTLSLGLGLLGSLVTLASFVAILWRLSGTLVLPIGGGLAIPGYMVWVALVYSLAGTWLNHLLGQRLIALNAEQQRVEADFRYALIQVREHGEAIALARGETREHLRLADRFAAIRANWDALIRTTKRLTWYSAGYGQVAIVFPILAAAPRYFSGAIKLGGLMQTAQAFGQVQGALSWLIDAYPQLSDWRATVGRLGAFMAAGEADIERFARRGVVVQADAGDEVRWSALSLRTPAGDRRIEIPAQRIRPRDALLVAAPSGRGKSSLLRALAGLWRDGEGSIAVPASARLMVVPQRPYLPQGSLAEAVAYPRRPDDFAAEAIAEALRQAGLGRHVARLNEAAKWSTMLSPGEQQRLQFARVFLHRPDWVFLDESTSSLDEAAERELYRQLRHGLPATTVVSIGHRSTLAGLHDKVWRMPDAAPPLRDAGAASRDAARAA